MLHKKSKILIFIMLFMSVLPTVVAEASVIETFPITQGGRYTEIADTVSSYPQSIRKIEVDLQAPFTKINLSFPNPLNSFATTTSQALKTIQEGKRVVGAINGSFFEYGNKLPMYLISYENELVNIGLSSFESEHFVNKPIAFGIDRNGNALIDRYQLELHLRHSEKMYNVTNLNKVRSANELIVYTPEFQDGYTNTNQYGVEVILSNATKNRDLAFGDKVRATVSGIRSFGDATMQKIPEGGLILSAHGDKRAILEQMKVGDPIEFSIGIDDKWMNSSFMLAGGPSLVNNGVNVLDMSPSNPRAQERAPRTAIAVDNTGTKVYMITVDGRQAGYSKGMTLNEFSNYLVKLGVYKALNLDGGGSTTMLARKPSTEYATLINKPSDQWERAVSTTLQVISTAPLGEPLSFDASLSTTEEIKVGSTVEIEMKNIVDQYYNPLPLDSSKVQITTDIGQIDDFTFKATQPGEGTITVNYGNATAKLPVVVKEEPPLFTDVPNDYKYFTEIAYLTENGLIKGFEDGTFRPLRTLSRAEAAILLIRALDIDTNNLPDIYYADVPKDYKYYDMVAAVVNAGIMKGKSTDTFDPSGPLTREEMAVILDRGFNLTGEVDMPFTDVTPKNFGYDSIATLVANDVTKGFPDHTYRPKSTLTREQFSLFLYRLIK